jgi:catechol 2,3-dioxygenase-like lactoylglutathione lyase family enzyme
MSMRLRQVALVARDLARAREDFFAVLGLEADFNDPGVGEFGLGNSVMALGDTFLEVVSPIKENTAAGRFLARRGGDGGYMVIVQVDDVARRRAEIDRLGVRVVWETKGDRAAAFHIHPADVGGAIVSFDQMWPSESWQWAGPGWEQRRAANVSAIVAVDIQSPDPAAMATRWSEVFRSPASGHVLDLDSGAIRFVRDQEGRGPGVTAVDLAATNATAALAAARNRGLPVAGNEITICGATIRLQ